MSYEYVQNDDNDTIRNDMSGEKGEGRGGGRGFYGWYG